VLGVRLVLRLDFLPSALLLRCWLSDGRSVPVLLCRGLVLLLLIRVVRLVFMVLLLVVGLRRRVRFWLGVCLRLLGLRLCWRRLGSRELGLLWRLGATTADIQ